jgi:membrane associated rhomboid family serine protease
MNLGGHISPAIKAIMIACAAVFFVQTVAGLLGRPYYDFINWWFGLRPRGVLPGLAIWQPFTYLFLHGGIFHLLFNMLVLWMFGTDIERAWGKRRFYFYYFLTGVGAALINVASKWIVYPSDHLALQIPTIGASGAIYGVLVAAALTFPDRHIWIIPFPVTLPMRVYVLILAAITFYFSIQGSGDNVSHISHLSGMLIGYLYLRRGSYFYRVRNSYSDWQRRRLLRRFEVYKRRHEDKPPSRPDDWVN